LAQGVGGGCLLRLLQSNANAARNPST